MNPKSLLVAAAVTGLLTSQLSLAAGKPKADAKAAKEPVGNCTEANDCHGKGKCTGLNADGTPTKGAAKNSCAHHVLTGKTEKECKEMGGTWKQS